MKEKFKEFLKAYKCPGYANAWDAFQSIAEEYTDDVDDWLTYTQEWDYLSDTKHIQGTSTGKEPGVKYWNALEYKWRDALRDFMGKDLNEPKFKIGDEVYAILDDCVRGVTIESVIVETKSILDDRGSEEYHYRQIKYSVANWNDDNGNHVINEKDLYATLYDMAGVIKNVTPRL